MRSWELDPDGRVFRVDGEEVALTRTEFNILELLMGRPRKVFTKQELFARARHGGVAAPRYGPAARLNRRAWSGSRRRRLAEGKLHVSNLRRKLKPTGTDGYLQTVWGMGYKLHNA